MRHPLAWVAAASLFALLVGQSAAQTNWIERRPAHQPSAQAGHALVYDSLRGRAVLFGGDGETWEWDGNDWLLRAPLVSPPANGRVGMAFDSARGKCVLVVAASALLQAWEWDGVNWTQIAAPGAAMAGGSRLLVAYDSLRARTCVVESQSVVSEWDGQAWSTIQSPVPMVTWYGQSGLCFDPLQGKCVFHVPFTVLSYNPYYAISGSWGWDGTTWSPAVAGGAPPYSLGEALCNSVRLGATVSYGGFIPLYTTSPATQTWHSSGPWVGVHTTGKHPKGRYDHAMCEDTTRGTVLLFGGFRVNSMNQATLAGDTWEYVLAPLAAMAEPYGVGCGAPAPQLDAAPGSRPVLGSTFTASLVGAFPGVAAVTVGFGTDRISPYVPLPGPLDYLGMTGCMALHSSEVVGYPVQSVGGLDTVVVPIPLAPSLVTVQIYLQAYTAQPGANPAGVVLSNGLQLTIGDL